MTIRLPLACMLACALTACGGGTKLIRAPTPLPGALSPAIAAAHDAQLAAELRFLIVRNGPGAWAKNADWDEYLLAVGNVGHVPLRIDSVTVSDSRGHVNATHSDRGELVKASKQVTKRYRDDGLRLEAGRGGATLMASAVGTGVVGTALGYAAAYGAGSAATAVVGIAGMAAAPVLLGVGVMRMVNNGKVDDRIEDRATALPLTVAPGAETTLDLFYPLSPSPQLVVVHYHDGQTDKRLEIDISKPLAGLHLPAPGASR